METMYDKLLKAFLVSKTDKRHHGYINHYARLFELIGEPARLLEVGIKEGKSIWSWEQAFSNCNTYGIDIVSKDTNKLVRESLPTRKRVHLLFECDSSKVENEHRMHKFLGEPVDVIIDDGAHDLGCQFGTLINFRGMFEKAYIIEDVLGEFNLEMLKAMVTQLGLEYHVQESIKPLVANTHQYMMICFKKGTKAEGLNV